MVKKAWIFGSFSRGDETEKSDLDIAIETEQDFSYFDLSELQHQLENELGYTIDIGFKETLHPQVFQKVQDDMYLVYER